MKRPPFATAGLLLKLLACPPPTRCPYCPADAPLHWTHDGSYTRYAGDPDEPSRRVAVPRYECQIGRRTFSVPPDALLPYCGTRVGFILQWLRAMLIEGAGLRTISQRFGVARGTLRGMRTRFLRTALKLRLAGHEGCLDAASFLTRLARMGAAAIAELFRSWKQQEPKLSILGIYAR